MLTNTGQVSCRRVYDPRVRHLICATGNPGLFPDLNIPESTIRGWLRGEFRPAVGIEPMLQTEADLHAENAKLRRRVRVLRTIMCLLLVLVRVTGCRLDKERLPDGVAKERLLNAIEPTSPVTGLIPRIKCIVALALLSGP